MRRQSMIAPGWWDYTTLDRGHAGRRRAARRRRPARPQPRRVSRSGSTTRSRTSTWPRRWSTSTPGGRRRPTRPAGICGPIGPTEQLPLVARLVNELELDLRHCHFWGMDEWVVDGKEAGLRLPAELRPADMELCFNRIRPELRMPPRTSTSRRPTRRRTSRAGTQARCVVMQGGQGEVKHWAFNDPPKREGAVQGRAAAARGVPQAEHARGRPAPDDHHPERAHLGRRRGAERAHPGGHGRAGRDLEGGEGVDLARRACTTTRSACG